MTNKNMAPARAMAQLARATKNPEAARWAKEDAAYYRTVPLARRTPPTPAIRKLYR